MSKETTEATVSGTEYVNKFNYSKLKDREYTA